MKNEKLKTLVRMGVGLMGLLLPARVYAAEIKPIVIPTAAEPVGAIPLMKLGEVMSNALYLVIIFAALLTVAYLIWGGIDWLTSGGEKASYQAARDRITHAFIGLGIVVASWLIIQIVEQLFGIKILGGFEIPRLWKP